MTAYRRLYVPGASYFFTLVTQERRPFLAEPDAVERLRSALRYAMERRPFKIDAMVILPDHICDYLHYNPAKHGLVACPRDWPYSSFARFVRNGIYALDWGCTGEPSAMDIPSAE